jgi:nucleoporin NUP2
MPSANPFAALGNQEPVKESSTNAFSMFAQSSTSVTTNGTKSEKSNDKQVLQRALNEKFQETIAAVANQDIYGTWDNLVRTYLKHSEAIASGSITLRTTTEQSMVSSGFGTRPAFEKPFSAVSTGPPSEPLVKQPFTLEIPAQKPMEKSLEKPVVKPSAPEPITIDRSDESEEEPEVKIQGPQFTLSTLPTAKDSPFSFSANGKKKTRNDSDSEDDVKIEGPSFSLPNLPTAKEVPFKLQQEKPQDKPLLLSIGQSESKPEDKSTATSSKPISSFSTSSDHTWSAEKGIKFGESTPAATPFQFGASSIDSNITPFKFTGSGSNETVSTAITKTQPATSLFGSTASSNDSVKPFSFGSESSTTKPFTFGAAASAPAKPFAFQPSLTNPPTGAESAPKPFSFGAGASGFGETPQFSFGGSSSNEPPKPFQISALSTVANPFDGTNPFAFGSSNSSAPITPATIQPSDATEADDQPASEPQTDLSEKGPGEEGEMAVYEKKAKVYELMKGEYKVQGAGPLRVLVDNTTKRARILVRAEGSGRVILNVLLRSQFNYTTEGKGQVKVLGVKADGSPTTYLIRVKTEQDGTELRDALENSKGLSG